MKSPATPVTINTVIVGKISGKVICQNSFQREIPSSSYNSDCLADAIACYVAYDEYDIDSIMAEISEMIKKQKE